MFNLNYSRQGQAQELWIWTVVYGLWTSDSGLPTGFKSFFADVGEHGGLPHMLYLLLLLSTIHLMMAYDINSLW